MNTTALKNGIRWLGLALILCVWLAGCERPRTRATLPSEIVGEWRTSDPRYEGRFLRLDTDQVTIGLGGVAPDQREHVVSVSLVPSDNPTDYIINLKTEEGTSDTIVLVYSPINGGELRMKSQSKILWKRSHAPLRPVQRERPPEKKAPARESHIGHQTIYKIDCIQPETVCHSY